MPLGAAFRLIVTGLVAGFACLASSAPSLAQPAQGNANPTLAYNLGGTSDYAGGMQFLDIAKTMRPWIGHKPGQWGGMTYEELVAGGYIDAQGWVRAIPPGMSHVGTLWQWKSLPDAVAYRIGKYTLTYKGRGELSLSGDARILEQAPGRIVFENRKGQNIYLAIASTDPGGTGDYIRDISIIADKHADLHAAGALFNPDWLALVADTRVLRFMNWGRTNNAAQQDWSERPTPEGLFSGRGIPLEVMVQLANEVGADPWFTLPHLADAAYVRAFADYVRTHLDPHLTVYVQYSNETWNGAFQQSKWLHRQSEAAWGKADIHAYHVKKATEVALIWNDVFGPQAEGRLIHVLGTQTTNIWATQQRLEARMWKRKERQAYRSPPEVFDALAVAPYFGGAIVKDKALRRQLIAELKRGRTRAETWLAKRLRDPKVKDSLPSMARILAEQAAEAEKHGLKLIAYEGGQHVHHSFAVKGLKKADIKATNAFLIDFVRSRKMAALYREIWAVWAEVGQGPFMQFNDMGSPSRWGSWGLRQTLNDDVPRAAVLDRLNARSTPWWDAKPGAHYLQGVTRWGQEGPDMLTGTDEEDYLIGRGGDDIFRPGPGDDGVHGGAGFDVVVLAYPAAQYTLQKSGSATELIGPDGTDRLVSIEALEFRDAGPTPLADIQSQ